MTTAERCPECGGQLMASSLFGVGYDESGGGDADGTDSLAKRCHRLKIHGWFWFSFHRMFWFWFWFWF